MGFLSNAWNSVKTPLKAIGIGDGGDMLENLLFGKKPKVSAPDEPAPPSRNDVIQTVLDTQLQALDKKKNSQIGVNTAGDQTATLASTTLFGL